VSEAAYLMARVSKSYVNGVWQPITKLPKARLKRAVTGGRFGQHHLGDMDKVMNMGRNANIQAFANRRASAKVEGTVRNIHGNKGGGGVMERIVGNKGADMPGPHVNWGMVPGQRHQIRVADKKSMGEVQSGVDLIGAMGAKHTMGDLETVNAHEMAHATRSRRPFASRLSADVQRGADKERSTLAMAVGLDRAKKKPTVRQMGRIGSAQQRMMLGSVKRNLGEEARADVMATRKLGRHSVSGHTLDTGDPQDYLRIRNKIERGMKMPRTKLSQVYEG
jgi:hypothetical protein